MSQVRISDLKAHLSAHLRAVQGGEVVTVLDRSTPIARIVPYSEERLATRPARRRLQDVRPPELASVDPAALAAALAEERKERL